MNRQKKSDFIKGMQKHRIINYIDVIYNVISNADIEIAQNKNAIVNPDTQSGQYSLYMEILNRTFQDKSKLAIFMLIFFDTFKINEILTKIRDGLVPKQIIMNGELKLNMDLGTLQEARKFRSMIFNKK